MRSLGPRLRHNVSMEPADVSQLIEEARAILKQSGAVFGYLHGSRVTGSGQKNSDIDLAAFFGVEPPQAYDILLPPHVDLVVLDTAPLELAGRVAATGQLLFEEDPAARVRWEATTRKIYFDELPRLRKAHAEFAAHARQV